MAVTYGRRLHRLRTAAGLTQKALGLLSHVDRSRIAQLEGVTGAKPTMAISRALDRALGSDDLLAELQPYVYRETFPDWSQRFMDLEAQARKLGLYVAQVVPGLLQTEAYARAMLTMGRTLTSPEQLEERVLARLGRQGILTRADGPQVWVVLDEAVLRRTVGDTAVMRGQFAHLLRAFSNPRMNIQVLPFSSGHHQAMGGSLTIVTKPDGAEAAYLEGSDWGRLVEEPEDAKSYAATYDDVRALALPPSLSRDLIQSVMEDNYLDARVPTRSQRRRLAQVQLQQSGGRRVRRGG
ncbi:helix-turn-helix domain-containing protein [Streptomyces varsoviensis]|uniref:DNA-binding protein n=1 Tax=Streptomyces varsoviensis TaxID=67373 RepID=A0ABR5JEN8_9ACTN|nr:helix-turn-helix transcriptional regulator [Streptomyces varsoviensis]KOG91922.1 DNA-binding protein [Streptomyces varsoviensis]